MNGVSNTLAARQYVSISRRMVIIAVAMIFMFNACSGDNGSYSETSSSSAFSSSSNISSSSRSVVYGDPVTYDGETYQTVVIGTQIWFKRNLNYDPNTGNSACYGNEASNCDIYGRLYDWATAMDLPSSCNSSTCSRQVNTKHRGICPNGWHIPSNGDWDKLMRHVDGDKGTNSPYDSPTAGRYLKDKATWRDCGPSGSDKRYLYLCEDDYGFSALPGGYTIWDGYSSYAEHLGYWWSSSESHSDYAYLRHIYYYQNSAYYNTYYKSSLFSVRCVQDYKGLAR